MDRGGYDRGTAGKRRWQRGGAGDIAVIASGPSLARWQCDHLRDKAPCIATNTSFRALAGPGRVYGCDGDWWRRYHAEVKAAGHEGWTQDAGAARDFGLNFIRAVTRLGLAREPGLIHHGANSGYQAISLAYQLGADRIILVGFDMQRTDGRSHWHGDHPRGLGNAHGIERWARNFEALAADLNREGVKVVNCTIKTALTCFPRADLRDVI